MKTENNDNFLEFYATKLYLQKLSEKYKKREYEKVFLEKDNGYLQDVKEIIKKINYQNEVLEEIIKKMNKNISKISKYENLPKNIKKSLVEDHIFLYAKFMDFAENIIKNEDYIIESIDRFRKIEKEINVKTKSLTKYGFDKEFSYIFSGLKTKIHKEITIIIFDQNNLKNINETYGHDTGQESIYKFGEILKGELTNSGFKYILSNYYGGDEWFLAIIDRNQKDVISFVKKFFTILNSQKFKVKDLSLNLSCCAGIAHFHPSKNTQEFLITEKKIIQMADNLVLQAKIQKNRNKSDNAYKAVNTTNLTEEDLKKFGKNIQSIPKKLKRETLDKKNLLELFEIRKGQNEKIMKARTLGVKKVLRYNTDLINEIIGQKILESISNVLFETKIKTLEVIPEITKKLVYTISAEIEKTCNVNCFTIDGKDMLYAKIFNSPEFQRFIKTEIEKIFGENVFSLQDKFRLK